MDAKRSFSIDVAVGEAVSIDRGRVVVTLLEKNGRTARIGFKADKDVPVNKVSRAQTGAVQAQKGIGNR